MFVLTSDRGKSVTNHCSPYRIARYRSSSHCVTCTR
jgi:hypothetical protein